MMNRFILTFLFLGFALVNVNIIAQAPLFREIRNKADYPFLLHAPEKNSNGEKPAIIIFLHGRSLSGSDLNMVKRYGVLDAIKRGRTFNAYVAAPQVKPGERWIPSKVLTVLDYLQKNLDTDLSRVYLVGMSLGGYGTLHFLGKYPERIAAAVALCGGGNVSEACMISKTNVWIQHGKLDKAVPFSESQKMYDAIKACKGKGDCFLTSYPNYGHGELAHEFYHDTLYNWIFQYRIPVYDSVAFHQVDSSLLIHPTVSDSAVATIEKEKVPPPKTKPKVHVVKSGESLSVIAQKHGTTVKKLCQLNGLTERSVLQIGQKIKLP